MIKNQIKAYRWTFGKDPLKLEKIWYNRLCCNNGSSEKNIEPGESCPHWLKITLWKELGRLVQKSRIAFFSFFFKSF